MKLLKDYVETTKRYIRNVYFDYIEMLYKSIKFILINVGIELKQDSPKYIFREGSQQNFYTQEYTDILIKCVDLRNTIIYEYDIYERTERNLIYIKNYKDILDNISENILNELSIR